MPQISVSYDGRTNLGGWMTLQTGIHPSRCLLLFPQNQSFDRTISTLTFAQSGTPGVSFSFPGAALDVESIRLVNTRRGIRYAAYVADRRWSWRFPRIHGCYNDRSAKGNLQTARMKGARDLVELLLKALGETTYDIADLPNDVFPPCFWHRAKAAIELEWICDLLGFVICLKTDNTFAIKPLNNQSGADLPAGNIFPHLNADGWKSAIIPSQLSVRGDPSEIQSALATQSYGLETDGRVLPLAQLSYRPTDGFTDPQWFADVDPTKRHLAFASVYRWFRPVGGWNADGVTVLTADDLEFLNRISEIATDGAGGDERPLPVVVKGSFWNEDEVLTNCPTGTIYTGKFKFLPELGVLETAKPVVAVSQTGFSEPTIEVVITYRPKDNTGLGYAYFDNTGGVAAAAASTDPRVLPHPELTKVLVEDAVYGQAGTNTAALAAEALTYRSQINATYNYDKSQDTVIGGLNNISPDGAIAQIEWKMMEEGKPYTRVGRYTEFDLKQRHMAQRLAERKLVQMAERLSI